VKVFLLFRVLEVVDSVSEFARRGIVIQGNEFEIPRMADSRLTGLT
jgi:hypothetical protein